HPPHGLPERSVRCGVAVVDVDGPRVQARGDAAAVARIASPDAGVEAVRGVVLPFDDLIHVPVLVYGHDRPEGLLGADGCVLRDIGKDRWLEEVRPDVRAGGGAGG